MNSKKYNIGIVDQPNANFDSDSLNIKPHADALTNFIERCDTPITIGIQGEWGSGKTSLLNKIYHSLEKEGEKYLQILIIMIRIIRKLKCRRSEVERNQKKGRGICRQ